MKKSFWNVLSMLILSALILAACAPSYNPAASGSQAPALSLDPAKVLNVAQAYYTKGYTLQNDFMKRQQLSLGLDTKFRLGLSDLFANNQACFADVASAESSIAKAVMGDQGMSKDAIVSVLATGGASVSGEQATTACVGLNKQIADYVIVNRSAMFDARQAAYEAGLNFKAFLHDQIGNYIINDLVMAATNNQQIKDWLREKNIGITDFTWLPTADLQYAITGSMASATCEYYMSGQAINELSPSFTAKFVGHEGDLKSLYQGTWNSLEKKCTLYRWAAFDKMMVVPVSAGTQDVYGTGVDTGAFPTAAPKK